MKIAPGVFHAGSVFAVFFFHLAVLIILLRISQQELILLRQAGVCYILSMIISAEPSSRALYAS